jgi:flavin reductase (DIM6/NTAB) family NADH-FMN oxidoreductase RutF
MAKRKMDYAEHYAEVLRTMTGRGLLLGSYDAARKANLMTIGWGSIGSIWNIPVWIVLVRPSRHTYECIEHSGCFTVNVPTESLAMACTVCGSKSGREIDKFAACKLTARNGSNVLAPTVEECPIVYECQVVHSNDVVPAKLTTEILTGMYVSGDFHRVYYGRIVAAYAEENAAESLKR